MTFEELRQFIQKRAGFHCEPCGVSADVRALEVDHIEPRNKGGIDDPNTRQAQHPNPSQLVRL
jgi:hypothetical protein